MSSSNTAASKSAPVLLPNAKKPSLLMRLFSTERKSSVYVMPTATVANENGDGAGAAAATAARQQQRQMKRLQSVDSATMQRDREAILKERRKQNRQQRDGSAATNHPSAPTGGQDLPASRHSIDGTGNCSMEMRPSSAIEGKTGSGSDSGRRKLSAQSGMKIQLTKDPVTSTPTAASEVSPTIDKMTTSPTGSAGRSLPSSPESFCAETHSPHSVSSGSPPVKQSNQTQHSMATTASKSGAKKSPDVGTVKPPLSPTAPPIHQENGSNLSVKRDTTSKKRASISVANSAPSDGGGGGNQRRAKSAGSAKSRNSNRKLKHRKKRAPQQSSEIKVHFFQHM